MSSPENLATSSSVSNTSNLNVGDATPIPTLPSPLNMANSPPTLSINLILVADVEVPVEKTVEFALPKFLKSISSLPFWINSNPPVKLISDEIPKRRSICNSSLSPKLSNEPVSNFNLPVAIKLIPEVPATTPPLLN